MDVNIQEMSSARRRNAQIYDVLASQDFCCSYSMTCGNLFTIFLFVPELVWCLVMPFIHRGIKRDRREAIRAKFSLPPSVFIRESRWNRFHAFSLLWLRIIFIPSAFNAEAPASGDLKLRHEIGHLARSDYPTVGNTAITVGFLLCFTEAALWMHYASPLTTSQQIVGYLTFFLGLLAGLYSSICAHRREHLADAAAAEKMPATFVEVAALQQEKSRIFDKGKLIPKLLALVRHPSWRSRLLAQTRPLRGQQFQLFANSLFSSLFSLVLPVLVTQMCYAGLMSEKSEEPMVVSSLFILAVTIYIFTNGNALKKLFYASAITSNEKIFSVAGLVAGLYISCVLVALAMRPYNTPLADGLVRLCGWQGPFAYIYWLSSLFATQCLLQRAGLIMRLVGPSSLMNGVTAFVVLGSEFDSYRSYLGALVLLIPAFILSFFIAFLGAIATKKSVS